MALPKTRFIETTLRSPLLQLPVRSVVFELDAARVLYSPASVLTPEQLRDAGAITDLVAPSLMHTAGMKAAAAAHPSARLWGPVGVREKHPDLSWHGILGVDPWPFEAELALIPLPGMPKMNESLFLHHASKALFVTDMAFNVLEPKGLAAWMFYGSFGIYRRFAVSRLFLRFAKDRPAFEATLAKVAGLDFQHVVPSHGEPVLDDGKARLIAAFRERGLIK
ncbi:hypothetical protein [Corallococcus silvisoli]|uniref:hypothetical protein n=1 Tax=Corallococcus silvisoli TaxID=2697031 RepID=UPI00137750DE|nr:hypothetical protein [Corallococcus silvisoli]NBD11793.1 hypothetical protein [Corallococcus silvisoli]